MTIVSTRTKFGIPAFALLTVMLALSLFPVSAVHAGTGGNADIGGNVYSARYYYFTQRTIVSPASAGPDIAALKYSGPINMKLGAHDCFGPIFGPSQLLFISSYVGLVGDGAMNANQVFCLFTEPGGGGYTGAFSANLDWD